MLLPSSHSPSPSLPARAATQDSETEMLPSDCSLTLEGWSSVVKKIQMIFDDADHDVNLNDTH